MIVVRELQLNQNLQNSLVMQPTMSGYSPDRKGPLLVKHSEEEKKEEEPISVVRNLKVLKMSKKIRYGKDGKEEEKN